MDPQTKMSFFIRLLIKAYIMSCFGASFGVHDVQFLRTLFSLVGRHFPAESNKEDGWAQQSGVYVPRSFVAPLLTSFHSSQSCCPLRQRWLHCLFQHAHHRSTCLCSWRIHDLHEAKPTNQSPFHTDILPFHLLTWYVIHNHSYGRIPDVAWDQTTETFLWGTKFFFKVFQYENAFPAPIQVRPVKPFPAPCAHLLGRQYPRFAIAQFYQTDTYSTKTNRKEPQKSKTMNDLSLMSKGYLHCLW